MARAGMASEHRIDRLSVDDAGEILTLQRAAYVTEAILHENVSLPPLVQTLAELRAELADPDVVPLGIRQDGRLVGSVRVRVRGPVAELGRLIVAPDWQGRGLGTRLLRSVDEVLPSTVDRVELFTGERSAANLRLYEREGFTETGRESAGAYELVFMSRPLH
ncbi:MAG: GNAT family N-acetyltransferase [Propionibacteriaceae bacterium]|nr:GNAT family N-acetyltransferase [Propionibacteriaceae bacterium]